MKKTILQKAKEKRRPKVHPKVNKETIEASLAWCRDEITLTQMNKAMGQNNTGWRMYSIIALSLKKYLNDNYRLK